MKLARLFLVLSMSAFPFLCARQLIVVLDPAGDAAHAGRSIEDTYERSCTWQLAAEIKRLLKRYEYIACYLSRAPGQILESLEPVQLANRLPADLFVRLQCYYTTRTENQCHFYYLLRHPMTDWWRAPMNDDLQFISLETAHQGVLKLTKKYADSAASFLRRFSSETGFSVHMPVGIPCLNVQGLLMPACIIELGIAHAGDWHALAHPLARAIKEILFMVRDNE